MTTTSSLRSGQRPSSSAGRVFPAGGTSYWLGRALVLAALAAATVTFFVPGILTGPAAMNGSARGTALVVLVLAVPLLAWAMAATSKGHVRSIIVWLGATAYLLYNALMFIFATPFNALFLVYVSMLSLALWSLIAILRQLDVQQLAVHFKQTMPVRAIAIYVWIVVWLNLVAWLRAIIPALFHEPPAAFLEGTGLTTNPVYVQDLAFWLLLMTVAAAWLWQRKTWGYLIAGSMLTMWVLESVGIAADQWFGHAADPSSPVVSAAMVWVFAALAVIGCVPLFFYFKNVQALS